MVAIDKMMLFWNGGEEGTRQSISVVQNSRSKWISRLKVSLEGKMKKQTNKNNGEIRMDVTLGELVEYNIRTIEDHYIY